MGATALLAVASGVLTLVSMGRGDRLFPAAALALYSASAGLFWWAVPLTRGKLAACGQGCVSGAVLRTGPYRFVRHPFYLSYNLMWVAGFVATGWWVLALAAVGMGALYESFARAEERDFLAGDLAGEYGQYRLTAGRYWPLLGKSTNSG